MKRATRIVILTSIVCLFSVNWTFAACPSADLNGDCFVGLDDLLLLSSQWLDVYDLDDFAVMADQWLTTGVPDIPTVQELADSVSQMDYMMHHDRVESCGLGFYGGSYYNQGYRNRNGWEGLGSLGNQEARLYITDAFTDMGLEHYASGSYIQGSYLNVIGKLTGTTTPEKVYIIGGHYDHTSGDRPGGDDNASGTAGVLEAARIMSQHNFESTILFMCFNAEEDGLKGAWDFVNGLTTTQKNNIKGMTNLDMILRPGSDPDPGHVIDIDIEVINDPCGDPTPYPYDFPASIAWGQAFQQAGADYVPSITVDSTIASYIENWSDHAPFVRAGLPAILIIENSGTDWACSDPCSLSNIYYHTAEDASDRLANDPYNTSGVTYDYAFATDVVRVSVALTAQEAVPSAPGTPDTTPPTPNPATFASAPSADSSSAISMTATEGTDVSFPVEYLFTETSGNPGATSSGWQVSPSYTDSDLTPDTTYTYTVTMRDAPGNTGTPSAGASATTIDGPVLINVVLPANGGNLDSYTSQYSTSYAASYLTNGLTNETGWSSLLYPEPPQEFVYSFSDGNNAILNEAVIHGGTAEGTYYSKDVEVWTSADGTNYTNRGGGMLEDSNGSTVTVDLGDVTARKVKLVITEGYSTEYWELAEFVVNGEIIIIE